eukprot:2800362-Pyramimonas_sp.AAC.1
MLHRHRNEIVRRSTNRVTRYDVRILIYASLLSGARKRHDEKNGSDNELAEERAAMSTRARPRHHDERSP